MPGRSVLVQQCKSEECESGERRRGSLREGEEAGTKDDEGTEMRPADEGLTGRRGRGQLAVSWLEGLISEVAEKGCLTVLAACEKGRGERRRGRAAEKIGGASAGGGAIDGVLGERAD